jgi:hypothetical protein
LLDNSDPKDIWVLRFSMQMAEKNKKMKEKEYIEKELSSLLEKTIQLENELYSIPESE